MFPFCQEELKQVVHNIMIIGFAFEDMQVPYSSTKFQALVTYKIKTYPTQLAYLVIDPDSETWKFYGRGKQEVDSAGNVVYYGVPGVHITKRLKLSQTDKHRIFSVAAEFLQNKIK